MQPNFQKQYVSYYLEVSQRSFQGHQVIQDDPEVIHHVILSYMKWSFSFHSGFCTQYYWVSRPKDDLSVPGIHESQTIIDFFLGNDLMR